MVLAARYRSKRVPRVCTGQRRHVSPLRPPPRVLLLRARKPTSTQRYLRLFSWESEYLQMCQVKTHKTRFACCSFCLACSVVLLRERVPSGVPRQAKQTNKHYNRLWKWAAQIYLRVWRWPCVADACRRRHATDKRCAARTLSCSLHSARAPAPAAPARGKVSVLISREAARVVALRLRDTNLMPRVAQDAYESTSCPP